MDIDEFQGALAAGLGRALRDARSLPVDARRACLLDACLRHRAFDPQLTRSRGRWLARVLEVGDDTLALAPRALAEIAALPDTHEFSHDVDQLLELAFGFARQGVPGAREALYAALEREGTSARGTAAGLILELDGLAGLEAVARSEGRALRAGLREPLDEYAFLLGRDFIGADAALERLEALARHDTDVLAYRDHVLLAMRAHDERHARPREAVEAENRRSLEAQPWWGLDWAGVEQLLLTTRPDSAQAWCRRWGQHCGTPNDLDSALRALATSTDRRIIVGVLRVFSRAALPRLEPRILALLDDDDPQIAHFAHHALHDREDDVVRRRALEHLGRRRDVDHAIALLAPTYTSRDANAVRAALPPSDLAGANHDVVFALIELLADRGGPDDADLLEWCYANAACESCRRRAVERLRLLGCLDASIADECRFDADVAVREVVTCGPQPADAPLPAG